MTHFMQSAYDPCNPLPRQIKNVLHVPMSILFLTSGLEPGRDGVGDYARLLAAECIRQKQACHLIALNDPYVSEPVEAMDSVGGTPILTLRLPARLAWGKRVERVRAFRSQHPCEWVSLQFVAYGFQRKGIVGNLARHLEPITAGRPPPPLLPP